MTPLYIGKVGGLLAALASLSCSAHAPVNLGAGGPVHHCMDRCLPNGVNLDRPCFERCVGDLDTGAHASD